MQNLTQSNTNAATVGNAASFHYQFTREIFGVNWTIEITPAGVNFQRGMIPHWMPFRDGTHFWPNHTHFMGNWNLSRRNLLRLAARNINRLRHSLALCPALCR